MAVYSGPSESPTRVLHVLGVEFHRYVKLGGCPLWHAPSLPCLKRPCGMAESDATSNLASNWISRSAAALARESDRRARGSEHDKIGASSSLLPRSMSRSACAKISIPIIASWGMCRLFEVRSINDGVASAAASQSPDWPPWIEASNARVNLEGFASIAVHLCPARIATACCVASRLWSCEQSTNMVTLVTDRVRNDWNQFDTKGN